MSELNVAGPSSVESSPEIFKLTTDCCDEIFDYLSLNDLYSFGQTCRTMQKIAGEYFKQNYSATAKYNGHGGIYTICLDNNVDVINGNNQTSGFNRYITNISHKKYDLPSLRYLRFHSTEFESIKCIDLAFLNISKAPVMCLVNLLPKLETLEIRFSPTDGATFDQFLKYCGNLKRLFVVKVGKGVYQLYNEEHGKWAYLYENPWLLKTYPHLEYFEFIPFDTIKMYELSGFFKRNPHVQTFSTSLECLWKNRMELLNSDAALDLLEAKDTHDLSFYAENPDPDDDETINIQLICKLLNKFHQRGFYKRLNMYLQFFNKEISTKLTSLKGLEKLYIHEFTECHDLPLLTNLKELAICYGANATDMQILATSLVHLQCLDINFASIDDILPFIYECPTLWKIKVTPKDKESFNGGILKLMTLNREREKLANARKIIIYVPSDVFLKTKWHVNGDINLKFIEMRRADSLEWNHRYC